MTKQKATTRDKLLACAIIIAFMSLNIVLGSFFSPGSWSPAVVTTATPPTHPQPPSDFASIDGALTLTISALTPEASVLGGRRMGEIRALIDSVSGSVDTDTQAASWTLTARLPAAADAPS